MATYILEEAMEVGHYDFKIWELVANFYKNTISWGLTDYYNT